ncbi:HesA/MoeB/ThiF family protein [Haliea sp. E17]|uniref:HesA/MoeB/ThiF family protein n=1 Tax=Haliea sp. E17 TaxID=3401576 RepID=UPI003AB0F688
MLSDEELLRYNRQLLLPEFDIAGQEALQRSRVLIVGMGGLGCPAALYLAAAGVGELHLADGDSVELSNLQRQIAHGDADIGRNKALSVAGSIGAINPAVTTRVIPQHLDAAAMAAAVASVDLVLDATDNYPARFDLNRACIAAGVPLVSAAAVRAEGQLALFDPHRGGPCYRCVYPVEGDETALSCSESGVLAPVVGVLGTLQAMEALKVLSGYGRTLRGHLLLVDLRDMQFQRLAITPRPGCPDCAHLLH